MAVGPHPNTDGLRLERAGIATDQREFIIADDQLRTNVPGVWAIGDVNARYTSTQLIPTMLADLQPLQYRCLTKPVVTGEELPGELDLTDPKNLCAVV